MVAVRGEPTLVRILGPGGRTRGTGCVADGLGTLVTSHEALDGPAVVRAPSGAEHRVAAEDVTPLPGWDLAFVRVPGLVRAERAEDRVRPAVFAAERARVAGREVRVGLPDGGWLAARITGWTAAGYATPQGRHRLDGVLGLRLPDGPGRLRLSRCAPGAPVADAGTGAVLAVVGAALRARDADEAGPDALAVPLRPPGTPAAYGPLGALLARNGAVVPGFGPDLNLAGALELTATSVGPAAARAAGTVERAEVVGALREFAAGHASVLALVGRPGTGRSTELAALAARRAVGAEPAPTVWLRGADLLAEDGSLREAVGRALAGAARIVTAAPAGPFTGDPGEANADVVARLARDAGRPLLVLLDAPEEMPPRLAHALRGWTAGTASWLRASGARLVVACRPEYWEQAGRLFPGGMLHPGPGQGGGAYGADSHRGTRLPPCVRLGGLPARQAAAARQRHGLPEGVLAPRDARHPLAIRMLAEIRAAQPGGADGREGARVPDRAELLSGYLGLLCLRVAVRLAAGVRPAPGAAAVRRLAAAASGQLHEAARRALGPGQGELDIASFEEIFPWSSGWASAVLAEEVLVPAGEGYRFADEELGDWVQGAHLELDAALDALIGRRRAGVPVPRHRIGPVVQALLLCGRNEGPGALASRLWPLADRAAPEARAAPEDGGEARWWAAHLLTETLLGLPDARPYLDLLRTLAERIAASGDGGPLADPATCTCFGPGFWAALPLPAAGRLDLLRVLLPADPPHGSEAAPEAGTRVRFIDAVGTLLDAEPHAVQTLLCDWFRDARPLPCHDGAASPTVATAAQALLYAHRAAGLDGLLDVLLRARHPRADELLAELLHEEPSALCRAVARWARADEVEHRAAAAAYAHRAVPLARTDEDRALLRRAAGDLLERNDGPRQRARALAVLVRDAGGRSPHLAAAVEHLAATGEPALAGALGSALARHPDVVRHVFRARLHQPGPGATALLRALAQVREPVAARRVAELAGEYAELRPEAAGDAVATYLRGLLGRGPSAGEALALLVARLQGAEPALRARLVRELGGTEDGEELTEALLARERDPLVLEELLAAVVRRYGRRGGAAPAGQVRRLGRLMSRTPEGALAFDRRLLELAREIPGFARTVRAWIAGAPEEWASGGGAEAEGRVPGQGTGVPAGHGGATGQEGPEAEDAGPEAGVPGLCRARAEP
ncbi:serine protease [Streptomyces sp. HNM0574]|uniref:serine protease n=1 Tax=Streptomyces sp. HNM0574 TaxID=2714954 RepID=UPI0014699F6A|nr:serine protease [Streptomyces sp. HNM0574]NLU69690.1 serine protease [Streptomyces sp. HNM0574]